MFAQRRIPIELLTPEDRERFGARAKPLCSVDRHAPQPAHDVDTPKGPDSAPVRLCSMKRRNARQEFTLILRAAMEAAGESAAGVGAAIDAQRQHVTDMLAGTRPFEAGYLLLLGGQLLVDVFASMIRRWPPGLRRSLAERLREMG